MRRDTALVGEISNSKPRFQVPVDACDCHSHIHADERKFPYATNRRYTPPEALPEDLARMHKALGIGRVVLVNTSIYGSDNSAAAWAMQHWGGNARGVATIEATTGNLELAELWRQGFRGVRLHMLAKQADFDVMKDKFRTTLKQISGSGMHVQMQLALPLLAAMKGELRASNVPLVFEHFALAKPEKGLEQPGLAELLELLASGVAYVKISAAYRLSSQAPFFQDMAPIVRAMLDANEDRVIWGSDWPHTDPHAHAANGAGEVRPYLKIDDGAIFRQVAEWAATERAFTKILSANPARLYGF